MHNELNLFLKIWKSTLKQVLQPKSLYANWLRETCQKRAAWIIFEIVLIISKETFFNSRNSQRINLFATVRIVKV